MKMIIMAARGKIGPGIDEIVEKPELDEFTSRVDSGFTIGVVKGVKGEVTGRLDRGFTVGVVKGVIREMMMVGEGPRQRVVLRVVEGEGRIVFDSVPSTFTSTDMDIEEPI
jgi:hypothetical protein